MSTPYSIPLGRKKAEFPMTPEEGLVSQKSSTKNTINSAGGTLSEALMAHKVPQPILALGTMLESFSKKKKLGLLGLRLVNILMRFNPLIFQRKEVSSCSSHAVEHA